MHCYLDNFICHAFTSSYKAKKGIMSNLFELAAFMNDLSNV